jgi:uncharacterized protein YPO0396
MPFTQNFYGSIGTNANIENLNGTLTINGRDVLTANSSANDLSQQLKQLAASVEALAGVTPETKAKAIAEIRAADREVQSEQPKGQTIKSHLETASGALKSATDVASNAVSLGKVLLEIGKWAIAIFV